MMGIFNRLLNVFHLDEWGVKMLDQLSKKITIALVALFTYSTIITVFISIFDEEKFLSFSSLWLTFFMLSAPMFLVVGVAVAFLLDKINITTVGKAIGTTLLGGVLVLPYSAYLFEIQLSNVFNYFLFGAVAGLMFYLVQFLFGKFLYLTNN
jgi:ABC-type sulfate transport system permease subunit